MAKKINITIDEDLLNTVDTYSKEHGLSRSALLSLSVDTYIRAQNALPDVQQQLQELQNQLTLMQR